MKDFFLQNKMMVGVVAGLLVEVGFCIALALGLLVAGEPIGGHLRWFGGMFVPLVLMLHFFVKKREQVQAAKGLIVVLFVTFIAYIAYMLRSGTIVLQQ